MDRANSSEHAKAWLQREISRMFPSKKEKLERQRFLSDLDKMTELEILKLYREWKV